MVGQAAEYRAMVFPALLKSMELHMAFPREVIRTSKELQCKQVTLIIMRFMESATFAV